MQRAILQRQAFLVPYFLIIAGAAWSVLGADRGELHLWTNQWHAPWADAFFAYVTHLGDGITLALVGLIALGFQVRAGLVVWTSGILTALVTQLLKRQVFGDWYRPVKFLELRGQNLLHEVPGVDLHTMHSFPSGHSTAAFALCFSLALLLQRRSTDAVLLLLAVLIAFSRVYLSQHFWMDVYVGSILGVTLASLAYSLFYRSSWKQVRWLNYSLFGVR